jgi:hypothetical protein
VCENSLCTAGTPVDCDDGDPLTTDGCDSAIGCTHTVGTATTTTTLATGATCTADAECPPDAEPCTVERCAASVGCTSSPVAGFESLACVCRRAYPAACDGSPIPEGVAARRTKACGLIQRAGTDAKKARKLVGKAAKILRKASKRLTRAGGLSPACVEAVEAQLTDGAARAAAVRTQL